MQCMRFRFNLNFMQQIRITGFRNSAGSVQNIDVCFQLFGRKLGTAPVIMVNHALTGNAQVCGSGGWWSDIVGPGASIDTDQFSIICINIPGNGILKNDEDNFHNYKEFTLNDIARIQVKVLEHLNITELFAIIGASIGGALAWQLAALKPDLALHVIPIATDLKSTDWLLANCKIQDRILNNSENPLEDARMHAMTFYRTPQSLSYKFRNEKDETTNSFKVENWLEHHGSKLRSRFSLSSYKLMNHLLTTINISNDSQNTIEVAARVKGHIHIITIDTDLFFLAEENWNTYVELSLFKNNVSIHEIKSIHGHDAFLIETDQVAKFLEPIFQQKNYTNENNKSRSVWAG